jgi:hypothetical protein
MQQKQKVRLSTTFAFRLADHGLLSLGLDDSRSRAPGSQNPAFSEKYESASFAVTFAN